MFDERLGSLDRFNVHGGCLWLLPVFFIWRIVVVDSIFEFSIRVRVVKERDIQDRLPPVLFDRKSLVQLLQLIDARVDGVVESHFYPRYIVRIAMSASYSADDATLLAFNFSNSIVRVFKAIIRCVSYRFFEDFLILHPRARFGWISTCSTLRRSCDFRLIQIDNFDYVLAAFFSFYHFLKALVDWGELLCNFFHSNFKNNIILIKTK